MAIFLQDLRYAARQFRRSPGFFAVAALLIALGIAANTQIFTLVNALLLRPLPVRDPQNLVQLFEIRPKVPAYPYFDYPLLQGTRQPFIHAIPSGRPDGMDPAPGAGLERGAQSSVRCHRQFLQRPRRAAAAGPGSRPMATTTSPSSLTGTGFAASDAIPRLWARLCDFKGHAFQIVGVAPEQFDRNHRGQWSGFVDSVRELS